MQIGGTASITNNAIPSESCDVDVHSLWSTPNYIQNRGVELRQNKCEMQISVEPLKSEEFDTGVF